MRVAVTLLTLSLLGGCSISDEDRCPEGMVYLSENMVCACPEGTVYDLALDDCVQEEDTETDTETDTDTDIDGGPDEDGGPDTDTETGTDTDSPSGFGEDCTEDSDCAEWNDVDFCAVNPLSSKGYCTIENCESGDCPDGWQCCDCSGLLGWIACLDDEYAKTAASMGCTCTE